MADRIEISTTIDFGSSDIGMSVELENVNPAESPLISDYTCTELKDGLTEGQKIDCLLPEYDFSDLNTLNALTPQQEIDLIADLCAPVSGLTCQQLNTGLTQAQRQVIQRTYPVKTGQTVSYYNGDDGFYENGRQVDFFTLSCNNPEGNTNRFTEPVPNYGIDYATGLAWNIVLAGNSLTWQQAIDFAEASVAHGYNDWYLPNINELWEIMNKATNRPLNYAPFNWDTLDWRNLWSSSSGRAGGTHNAKLVGYATIIYDIVKTNVNVNTFTLICRKHF